MICAMLGEEHKEESGMKHMMRLRYAGVAILTFRCERCGRKRALHRKSFTPLGLSFGWYGRDGAIRPCGSPDSLCLNWTSEKSE